MEIEKHVSVGWSSKREDCCHIPAAEKPTNVVSSRSAVSWTLSRSFDAC